ncbi:hypothetical protein JXA88_10170 [Candidatus Fermentibacteria bacterium]|nr:hypothetical protein [Candidatus Fermentibacteria bacterium]
MHTRFLAIVSGIMVLTSLASAEIPHVITYQGRVTDSGGSPVTDGIYGMVFQIYDAHTAGTLLWDSGIQDVQIAGGIFSVVLGESPQPALSLAFDQDYWLMVNVDGNLQEPRTRLGSVGYAYMASGLVPGTEVSGSMAGTVFAAQNNSSETDAAAVWAFANATSGYTHGLYATVNSPDGSAVFARGLAATGDSYGVHAQTLSQSGTAIYGHAAATTGGALGVRGISAAIAGCGVSGESTASTGYTYGVYGQNASIAGCGVYGWATASTGIAYGVHGETYSTDGIGVYGWATASMGNTYGVYGHSYSTAGMGVLGLATASTGTTHGVHGETYSTDGIGVYGEAIASSGQTRGVYGLVVSSEGIGVAGYATASTGSTLGVYGHSNSTEGKGVAGCAFAYTGTNFGVWGKSFSTSGYGVYYSGGLAGSGTKSCVVRTSQGPSLMYCQESPESWFEDFGEGRLVNGRCRVEMDPLFLETVTIDAANPMKVFVEVESDACNGVAIRRSHTGFDLVERHGGSTSSAFWYRVVAKRKGFEEKRLDYCAAAERDSYLYPELREKERQEYEKEHARRDEGRPRMDEEHRRLENEHERLRTEQVRAAIRPTQ